MPKEIWNIIFIINFLHSSSTFALPNDKVDPVYKIHFVRNSAGKSFIVSRRPDDNYAQIVGSTDGYENTGDPFLGITGKLGCDLTEMNRLFEKLAPAGIMASAPALFAAEIKNNAVRAGTHASDLLSSQVRGVENIYKVIAEKSANPKMWRALQKTRLDTGETWKVLEGFQAEAEKAAYVGKIGSFAIPFALLTSVVIANIALNNSLTQQDQNICQKIWEGPDFWTFSKNEMNRIFALGDAIALDKIKEGTGYINKVGSPMKYVNLKKVEGDFLEIDGAPMRRPPIQRADPSTLPSDGGR